MCGREEGTYALVVSESIQLLGGQSRSEAVEPASVVDMLGVGRKGAHGRRHGL